MVFSSSVPLFQHGNRLSRRAVTTAMVPAAGEGQRLWPPSPLPNRRGVSSADLHGGLRFSDVHCKRGNCQIKPTINDKFLAFSANEIASYA
jgi:hypothetical protein